jgi:deoxycytidine triphosphate deaminase
VKRNSAYIMSKIIDKGGYAKPAQVGVDLTVREVAMISYLSILQRDGKIELAPYKPFDPHGSSFDPNVAFWDLQPGAYAIEFDQGLSKLSPTENASIVQRSSLNRAGVQIVGSVYDPGFETPVLGATMYVHVPLRLYQHARVAQLLIGDNDPVDNLYEGRWQGVGGY